MTNKKSNSVNDKKHNHSNNKAHAKNTKNVASTKHVNTKNTNAKKVVPKKVSTKKEKALDHTCPGCRAPIFFVPSLGKWKCEYCDGAYTLEDLQKHNNASSVKHNQDLNNIEESSVVYDSYKCSNCGAEIVADSETSATFCVYCGNTAILKSKLSGEFKPDLIIPFKKEKECAIQAFKGLSSGRPFLPKDFNNVENIEKIRGIYIPFWIYDMNVEGGIEARGQIVTSWTRGNTHYTKTDFYKMVRNGTSKYVKIPIDGSSRFANDIMGSIEPFNYDEIVNYNHAYLSGFLAEKYDIDGDILIGNAVNRAVESTKKVFLDDIIGYSNKTIYNSTLRAANIKKQYALFPVWMVNVKYKDKYYLFAMNGQTGKFIGDMPVDKGKVVKWSIWTFIILCLVLLVISYVIFKIGVFVR